MATYVTGTATLSPATTSIGIRRLEQQLDVLVSNSNFFLERDVEKDADPDWMGLILSNVPQCSDARDSGIFYEGHAADGDFLKIYYRGRSDDGIAFFTAICNLLGFDAVLSYVWEFESTSLTKIILADESKFYPESLKRLSAADCNPMDPDVSCGVIDDPDSSVPTDCLKWEEPSSNWCACTMVGYESSLCVVMLSSVGSTIAKAFQKATLPWDLEDMTRQEFMSQLEKAITVLDSYSGCELDDPLYQAMAGIVSVLHRVPEQLYAKPQTPEGVFVSTLSVCWSLYETYLEGEDTTQRMLILLRETAPYLGVKVPWGHASRNISVRAATYCNHVNRMSLS